MENTAPDMKNVRETMFKMLALCHNQDEKEQVILDAWEMIVKSSAFMEVSPSILPEKLKELREHIEANFAKKFTDSKEKTEFVEKLLDSFIFKGIFKKRLDLNEDFTHYKYS